jgi:vacuolar iron transporter family protein
MLSRNLDKAMQAYEQGNPEASRQAHIAGKTEEGEPHLEGGERIKSLIYGGLDGIITTFAVVAGVAGAELAAGIVLIMGFANLIADGISMAIGDYLSTQAENEVATAERARESWEVDTYPEGEKREMVELYEAKGIPRDDAQTMVDILAQHKEAWVDVMMVEELGIIEADESPLKNALVTFVSFGVFGFIPLLAYVLARFIPLLEQRTFLAACVLTGATLFVLGAQKVRITKRSWLRSGLEMLIIGGIAAAAAYGIGVLLRGLA